MGKFKFSKAFIVFFTCLKIQRECEAQLDVGHKWGGNPFPRLDRTRTRFGNNFDPMEDSMGFIVPSKIRQKCPKVRIANGTSKMRDRGSLIRFQCANGFTLYGIEWAICIRGSWSHPSPICVRNGGGCKKFSEIPNGSARYLYGSSIVGFTCNVGFDLIGSSLVVCNGMSWNSSAPVCKNKLDKFTTKLMVESTLTPYIETSLGSEIAHPTTPLEENTSMFTYIRNVIREISTRKETIETTTEFLESGVSKSTTGFFGPSDFDFLDLTFSSPKTDEQNKNDTMRQTSELKEISTFSTDSTRNPTGESEKSSAEEIESNHSHIETSSKVISLRTTEMTTEKPDEPTSVNSRNSTFGESSKEMSKVSKLPIFELTTEKVIQIHSPTEAQESPNSFSTQEKIQTTQEAIRTTEETIRTTEETIRTTKNEKNSISTITTQSSLIQEEKSQILSSTVKIRKIPQSTPTFPRSPTKETTGKLMTKPTIKSIINYLTTSRIIDFTIQEINPETETKVEKEILDSDENSNSSRNEIEDPNESKSVKIEEPEVRGIRADDVLKIFDKMRLREEDIKFKFPGQASFTKIDKSHDYFTYTIPVLAGLIFVTMICGMFVYIWKRYKGISRRSMYEADGRPLSFATTEAHEEFTWMENSSL